MAPYTLKEVAKALRWKPSRIEKMISREYLVPEHAKAGGRRGRSWSFTDVVKLRLMDEIPGTAAEQRRVLDQIPFEAVGGLFVAIATWSGPESLVEIPLMGGGVHREWQTPPNSVHVLSAGELPAFVNDHWLRKTVLISLRNLERDLRSALSEVRGETTAATEIQKDSHTGRLGPTSSLQRPWN